MSSSPESPPLAPHPRIPIVRCLPKGSRRLAASKLSSLLEAVMSENSLQSWERLLSFTPRCLFSPRRGGKCWSLVTQLNRQLDSDEGSPNSLLEAPSRRQSPRPIDCLRAAVSAHLEEGDFRGAIRLASSDSSIAAPTNDTFQTLQDKHPSSPVDYPLFFPCCLPR